MVGEGIKEVDLDWKHRLGAPTEDKVSLIKVKFARYNTGSRVFRKQRN